MKAILSWVWLLAASLPFTLPVFCGAQVPGTVWAYQLHEGSEIVDDCPVCDRLAIVRPLRGRFDLRTVAVTPISSVYVIENLVFESTGPEPIYKIAGQGQYEIGGEVAQWQKLALEVWIQNGASSFHCFFTNTSSAVTRPWPRLQIPLAQTNGTITQQFSLDLNAAPIRDIWFSTAQDFIAGIWNSPSNMVSKGQLLSASGRRVKSNQQLTARLGIMPAVPDVGLKDLDILNGGEVIFSINEDIFSESLGRTLGEGDLLSNRGVIVRTNADLVAAFMPDNLPAAGAGLAAVQMRSWGEVWFSVETGFRSSALNRVITPGDLLSERGWVIRSNGQLLSRFNPVGLSNSIPLTSVYVWPGGEIWFSLGEGFTGGDGRTYEAGDLLSDQGDLIFRGSEVLSKFAPVPSGTNIALDGLYLITDVVADSPAPVIDVPTETNHPPSSLALRWHGEGHVFQLEGATRVSGPFSAVSPIMPDMSAVDEGAQTNGPAKFYRVRQW